MPSGRLQMSAKSRLDTPNLDGQIVSGATGPKESLNQNCPLVAASRFPLVSSFSSHNDAGMTKSHLSSNITPTRTRITATLAAFSKSVIWTSGVRNSTRQPMSPEAGGGLNRTVPQFVPCNCSQWSASRESSMSMRSSKTINGSLTRMCATCRLNSGSNPPSCKCLNAGTSIGTSISLAAAFASGFSARSAPMKRSFAEVREFRTLEISSWHLSSQVCLNVGQRVSVSATRPRRKGVAAVKARSIGARTKNWSVKYRASHKSRAKNVACMQHWQAPKACESI
mmetsp:Transcript_91000/g.262347  ORF Transcript_91000/g.262347 Transcript_91000/m.262347 type:complete len:282 (+) Transcript_91000:298-1143(+)